MGRYSPGVSYSHRIQRICEGEYRISWVVDFYYKGNRQRHPRSFHRYTDVGGALRFAEKWDCAFPEEVA